MKKEEEGEGNTIPDCGVWKKMNEVSEDGLIQVRCASPAWADHFAPTPQPRVEQRRRVSVGNGCPEDLRDVC